MNKAKIFVLAALMAVGMSGQALAIEVKASGTWDFTMGWANNTNFYGSDSPRDKSDKDSFSAAQRVRTQLNFIASEQLQGVLAFEIGTLGWGSNDYDGAAGGALDADGVNVETKRAYLDWTIPNTPVSVRMGIQGLSLPMATGYGNPVFGADVAGILVSSPITENLSVTAFWARPFDQYSTDPNGKQYDDEMDMFGVTVPISGEGWKVTPWAVYSKVGSASGYYEYVAGYDPAGDGYGIGNQQDTSADAWWGGTGFELTMFDPLTFAVDAMYGHLSKENLDFTKDNTSLGSYDYGTEGWFVTAVLNYKLDWATPGLFGWYATGDDKDDVEDGQYGRMPVVGTDDGFNPTSFGFPGSASVGTDGIVGLTGMGTWGVGVQLADMSFVPNLSHTLRVAYYQGTNDHEIIHSGLSYPDIAAESIYMTDKDSAIEVNFDHQYQIYENLTAFLELGYINMNLDSDTWSGKDEANTEDAWKAQVSFQYKF